MAVERRLIGVAKEYLFTMSSRSVSAFSRTRFRYTHLSPTLSIVTPSSELNSLASLPNGLFDRVIVVESTDLGNLSRICATRIYQETLSIIDWLIFLPVTIKRSTDLKAIPPV